MTRFTKKITSSPANTSHTDMAIVILSGGIGNRIKSYEPRSLLKLGNQTLIDHQISVINNSFHFPEIIGVFGYLVDKIAKKIRGKIRIIENQIYENTNTSESLRLAFNSTTKDSLLFFHGDLYFNIDTLEGLDYSKSFLVVDNKQQMHDKEVGITICDHKATILSYGLPTKWCQIAYITGKEFRILKHIFQKFDIDQKKLLVFEVINHIITMGGQFYCYEPHNMSILEIDCIKDINYENFNQ